MRFTALYGSELRRLTARRSVRWTVAVAVALVAVVVLINAARSTGTGFDDHTMYLRKLWLVGPDNVQETAALAVGTYLMILGVVLAATGIGGDYRAGTLGTVLTWEPRRIRLAVARLLAIGAVTVGVYLGVIGVFIGSWWLGSSVRGSNAGIGPDFWTNLAGLVGRSAVGVVLLAVITAGLALLTRGTVGALVVWFGYLVGVEGILGGRITGLRSSLLIENLAPFLQGRALRVRSATISEHGLVVSPGAGLVHVVVIAAVVVVAGVLVFRRRDVI